MKTEASAVSVSVSLRIHLGSSTERRRIATETRRADSQRAELARRHNSPAYSGARVKVTVRAMNQETWDGHMSNGDEWRHVFLEGERDTRTKRYTPPDGFTPIIRL